MDWKEAEKKLRTCDCGCPVVEIFAEEEDHICFAQCSFCEKRTESSGEPWDVINWWNLRGGKCEECDGLCEDPEDELCPDCFRDYRSNVKHEARG